MVSWLKVLVVQKEIRVTGEHTSEVVSIVTTSAIFFITLFLLAEFTFLEPAIPHPFADGQSSFLIKSTSPHRQRQPLFWQEDLSRTSPRNK